MEKKIYTSPQIEIIQMQIESLLEVISLPINPNPSDGGGDAKQDIFEDEEETEEIGYKRTLVWDE